MKHNPFAVFRGSRRYALAGLAMLSALLPAKADGTQLEVVRARGALVCGLVQNAPGFSTVDSRGNWSGIDVDFCRAVAAAVLGDETGMRPLAAAASAHERMLASGEIDLLAASSAVTFSRAVAGAVTFPTVLYYEPVAVMVQRKQAITSARELSGATICTGVSEADKTAVGDYFEALGMRFTMLALETWESRVDAYRTGRCLALAADASMLGIARTGLDDAAEHQILPEALAMSSLSPAVRSGDPEWTSVIGWVKHALVAAEQLGITKATVEGAKASKHPAVRRLLGRDVDIGKPLGLARDWVAKVIAAVGNYGEIIERNVGKKSPLRLDRRHNDLWSRGGLHVAPSFR